jgi:diadenosine tetraphosphate (Ap4A) HIT family hydrolase
MPCLFCDDPHAAGDIVLDDPAALVLVHPDWAVPGHLMVAAKQHVENLSDLTDADRFMAVYRRAERAILELTKSERAIVMKLGIQTPHLHLHIYPVRAALDRGAVMEIIDRKVRHEPDHDLVRRLRVSLSAHTR